MTIILLIPLIWLAVTAIVVTACWAAAHGDEPRTWR